MTYIKHIENSSLIELKDQITILENQVVSKTLVQNSNVSLTLFGFSKGQVISSHKSTGDAMISVLAGTCQVTIDGKDYLLQENQTIIMPANLPHAVLATSDFKMLLTVIFPY